jgi:cytochrome b
VKAGVVSRHVGALCVVALAACLLVYVHVGCGQYSAVWAEQQSRAGTCVAGHAEVLCVKMCTNLTRLVAPACCPCLVAVYSHPFFPDVHAMVCVQGHFCVGGCDLACIMS